MAIATDPTHMRYRQYIAPLVERHKENYGDKLLLSVSYTPERDESDIFLLTVLAGFHSHSLEENGDILEVLYGSTNAFPLFGNDRLHILLTSPEEFEEAKQKQTSRLTEFMTACKNDKAILLYRREGSTFLQDELPQ